MRKKILTLALAAVMLAILLAGCGGGDKAEAFPGQFNVPYPLGDMFTIDATRNPDGDYKWVRYICCMVTLELSDATFTATLDTQKHRVREIVIFTVSSKRVESLITVEQKQELLDEIKTSINEEFNTTAVNRVVFSEFFFHT